MELTLRSEVAQERLISKFQEEFCGVFKRRYKIDHLPEIRAKMARSFEFISRFDGHVDDDGPVNYEAISTLDGTWCQNSYSVYYCAMMSEDDLKMTVLKSLTMFFTAVLMGEGEWRNMDVGQVRESICRQMGIDPNYEWLPRTMIRHGKREQDTKAEK
jgi:hypothetical protein